VKVWKIWLKKKKKFPFWPSRINLQDLGPEIYEVFFWILRLQVVSLQNGPKMEEEMKKVKIGRRKKKKMCCDRDRVRERRKTKFVRVSEWIVFIKIGEYFSSPKLFD
jgi:hypothetical protein